MRTTPRDRLPGNAPVPARTWRTGRRTPEFTLNVEQTDGGDLWVLLWTGDVDTNTDGRRVLLDQTQIDELITDLVERRALLATRRAGSGRSDR